MEPLVNPVTTVQEEVMDHPEETDHPGSEKIGLTMDHPGRRIKDTDNPTDIGTTTGKTTHEGRDHRRSREVGRRAQRTSNSD